MSEQNFKFPPKEIWLKVSNVIGACVLGERGALVKAYTFMKNDGYEKFIHHAEHTAQLAEAKEALMLIAAPKRADGTYNRSREACERLAREALTKIRGGK